MQRERFLRGQVPPQLVLLPHHQREAAAVVVVALPRHVAQHARLAGRRRDDAGEQLERRGLAGAVGAEKGDELALLDVEVDAAHRVDVAVLAVKQAAQGGAQAFLLLIDAIGLRQSANFDDAHRRRRL